MSLCTSPLKRISDWLIDILGSQLLSVSSCLSLIHSFIGRRWKQTEKRLFTATVEEVASFNPKVHKLIILMFILGAFAEIDIPAYHHRGPCPCPCPNPPSIDGWANIHARNNLNTPSIASLQCYPWDTLLFTSMQREREIDIAKWLYLAEIFRGHVHLHYYHCN